MSDDRQPTFPLLFSLAGLTLALYIGAYALLLGAGGIMFDAEREPFYRLPGCRSVGDVADSVDECGRIFFAPIHKIDRHVRPHVWQPENER